MNDEIISEAIAKTERDQYGQIQIWNLQVGSLFPDKKEEVIEYLKISKKYRLSTYGWRYGTYDAISKI